MSEAGSWMVCLSLSSVALVGHSGQSRQLKGEKLHCGLQFHRVSIHLGGEGRAAGASSSSLQGIAEKEQKVWLGTETSKPHPWRCISSSKEPSSPKGFTTSPKTAPAAWDQVFNHMSPWRGTFHIATTLPDISPSPLGPNWPPTPSQGFQGFSPLIT